MHRTKPSIEPDDGYEFEKDNNHLPWEYWEKKRVQDIEREYPGLLRAMEEVNDKKHTAGE